MNNELKKDIIVAIGIGFALVGTFLNVMKIPACFYLWMVSNFIFLVVNASEGNWRMFLVFDFYFIMSIWGFLTW